MKSGRQALLLEDLGLALYFQVDFICLPLANVIGDRDVWHEIDTFALFHSASFERWL